MPTPSPPPLRIPPPGPRSPRQCPGGGGRGAPPGRHAPPPSPRAHAPLQFQTDLTRDQKEFIPWCRDRLTDCGAQLKALPSPAEGEGQAPLAAYLQEIEHTVRQTKDMIDKCKEFMGTPGAGQGP